MTDLTRVQQLDRALRDRASLRDPEWLEMLNSHRWAIGQLARSNLSPEHRLQLNAVVLRGHDWLHGENRASRIASLGEGLRRVARPFLWGWVCFIAGGLAAASAVLVEPSTVYTLVPRTLLGQIAESAWGQREGTGAGFGMTLFYSANNSRACLLALGLGVLGGVPGFAILAYNGALIGAVAAHAAHLGLLGNLVAWLGPHGVPELTAMMLSGAVGWELAMAWMKPGPRPRRDALAQTGLMLSPLVGAAVLLVFAAAPLEGFVSPLPLPLWVDASIAVGWCVLLVAITGAVLSQSDGERTPPAHAPDVHR
ncbi:MAG: stage II sporulation protein M [Myxococcota bacterium]